MKGFLVAVSSSFVSRQFLDSQTPLNIFYVKPDANSHVSVVSIFILTAAKARAPPTMIILERMTEATLINVH